MATLYPTPLPSYIEDDVLRAAERRVYDALREGLGQEFSVFYGVAWLGALGAGFSGEEEPTEETPTEGVEVCIFEHDEIPCVTTGADGKFSFEDLPADPYLVSFSKDGYPSYLRGADG
jgi:hypothetical protein